MELLGSYMGIVVKLALTISSISKPPLDPFSMNI
jgi:hypothetical protein